MAARRQAQQTQQQQPAAASSAYRPIALPTPARPLPNTGSIGAVSGRYTPAPDNVNTSLAPNPREAVYNPNPLSGASGTGNALAKTPSMTMEYGPALSGEMVGRGLPPVPSTVPSASALAPPTIQNARARSDEALVNALFPDRGRTAGSITQVDYTNGGSAAGYPGLGGLGTYTPDRPRGVIPADYAGNGNAGSLEGEGIPNPFQPPSAYNPIGPPGTVRPNTDVVKVPYAGDGNAGSLEGEGIPNPFLPSAGATADAPLDDPFMGSLFIRAPGSGVDPMQYQAPTDPYINSGGRGRVTPYAPIGTAVGLGKV